jgi:hypothetical protein
MWRYRLGGLSIDSELRLDDVIAPIADDGDRCDLRLRLLPARALPPLRDVVYAMDLDGEPSHVLARRADQWLIRTYGEADFSLDARGAEVVCTPCAGLAEDVLAQMFVDRALPLIHDLRGVTVLHASAVVVEGAAAVAFVGPRGRGKSTLAAALSPPMTLLADDSVVVEAGESGVDTHPSYAFVRLCHDAVAALAPATRSLVPGHPHKCRVQRAAARGRQPLVAIYALENAPGPVVVSPHSIRDAVALLARHMYRIDPTDRARLASELPRLERVARRLRVATLRYPRGFDALAEVREAIARDVAHTRSPSLTAP